MNGEVTQFVQWPPLWPNPSIFSTIFFFFFVIVGVDGEDCHGRMLERIIAWSISKISSNLGVDDEGERMIDFNWNRRLDGLITKSDYGLEECGQIHYGNYC